MRLALSLFVVFLTACAAVPTTPQRSAHPNGLEFDTANSVGMSEQRLLRIDSVLQDYVDSNELVGAVSMVARHGKVVHFEKFGTLNKDTSQPIELDSIFRIYSMSKPITTVAALQLYEQ